MNRRGGNRLGEEKTSILLRQFAIPSIIAMLVSSLYNSWISFLSARVWALLEMRW